MNTPEESKLERGAPLAWLEQWNESDHKKARALTMHHDGGLTYFNRLARVFLYVCDDNAMLRSQLSTQTERIATLEADIREFCNGEENPGKAPTIDQDGMAAAWAAVDKIHGKEYRVPMVELLYAYLDTVQAKAP